VADGVEISAMNTVADGAPSPERLAQNVELRQQLETAMAALTQAERTAFVMRHWDGCGIEEIAAALDSNASAAKNAVFRAVQKLRNALAPLVTSQAAARAMGTKL
jgi:RNA polymerase sigma-70 factor (ECF subfamily)